MSNKARLRVTTGPNTGDALSVENGSCRLIGRHLSEAETVMMDRHGNRVLDGASVEILEGHLRKNAPEELTGHRPSSGFDRGSDIVFSDPSISRAHAMVFFDENGLGVVDLASSNGTFVNGNRVNSAILAAKDVVRMGGTEISIEMD